VRLTPEDEADEPQPTLTREEALRRLAALLDMHWKRGTSPNGERQGLHWTNGNIADALEWTKETNNTITKRIKRMRCNKTPNRPNELWWNKLLPSLFGANIDALDQKARTERAELIALYAATAERPRVAKAPVFPSIVSVTNMQPAETVQRTALVPELLDWQFHCALTHRDVVYYIGSALDSLDTEPLIDGDGAVFRRRHVYVCKHQPTTNEWSAQYLTRNRPCHMAMRVLGQHLRVFMNHKVEPNTYQMNGTLCMIDLDTLGTRDVSNVFRGRNWGWSPYLDHQGKLHHGDSETAGSAYLIEQEIVPGKIWSDLTPINKGWLDTTCPHPVVGGGREHGYLRILVTPHNLRPPNSMIKMTRTVIALLSGNGVVNFDR
jgi:hypothetical protein